MDIKLRRCICMERYFSTDTCVYLSTATYLSMSLFPKSSLRSRVRILTSMNLVCLTGIKARMRFDLSLTDRCTHVCVSVCECLQTYATSTRDLAFKDDHASRRALTENNARIPPSGNKCVSSQTNDKAHAGHSYPLLIKSEHRADPITSS